MKKGIFAALLAVFIIGLPARSVAWGKRGHEMVAEIAFHFLDDSTQQIIKKYLGNLSIEEAANWMDDERGNSYYNYMRTWHYLDIDKGQNYTPSSERNILTILHSALVDLRQYKTNKRKDIKRDLLLIFHLVGDLHQPLHTGYAIDKGGNDVQISSSLMTGNLHSIWDSQIIEYLNITFDSCMRTYDSLATGQAADIKKINELKWMYDSRSYLDSVYSFQNNALDARYMEMAGKIIRMQLVKGGLRLYSILHEVFDSNSLTTTQTDGFINSLQIYGLLMKFIA